MSKSKKEQHHEEREELGLRISLVQTVQDAPIGGEDGENLIANDLAIYKLKKVIEDKEPPYGLIFV